MKTLTLEQMEVALGGYNPKEAALIGIGCMIGPGLLALIPAAGIFLGAGLKVACTVAAIGLAAKELGLLPEDAEMTADDLEWIWY